MGATKHFPDKSQYRRMRRQILSPEAAYFRLAILFSAIVSMLSLGIPISIQMLIDQVANTALVQPVIILAATLFGFLALSGVFYALREYCLELFERRFYARMTGEISMRVVSAPASYFESARRDDLLNRYFDIMTVKKTLPALIVGVFSFLFQAAIGFAVTSLYHPMLFVFNLIIVTVFYLIWRVWGWRATETAFEVSEAKYDTIAWIESLALRADFFKAGPYSTHALGKVNHLIEHHINMMRRHFRLTFQQMIALLALYALSSASLLGLGGWLVITGELTLGQLVAAELILSAIFAGFVVIAGYVKDYYGMAAAIEELDRIKHIPIVRESHTQRRPEGDGALLLDGTVVTEGKVSRSISLDVPAGTAARIRGVDADTKRLFSRLLKGHVEPTGGRAFLDKVDFTDWDLHHLAEEILVLDRLSVPHMAVGEFLALQDPKAGRTEFLQALADVQLEERVRDLEDGLDTVVAPSGWPFRSEELLRLRLAAALLMKPRLLVLSDIFDLIDQKCLTVVLERLRANRHTTILTFGEEYPLSDMQDIEIQTTAVTKTEGALS